MYIVKWQKFDAYSTGGQEYVKEMRWLGQPVYWFLAVSGKVWIVG
jgi:hypothetical protein